LPIQIYEIKKNQ